MAGGIIQLVAKGIQDIFLTSEPQITFFKMVYRRYTNFSKTELDLRFTNKLDFGKTGIIKIQKFGDLLHRLFLVIKLPLIDLVVKNLTIGEAQQLLLTVNIVWEPTPPKQSNSVFTQNDYNQVSIIVTANIEELQNEINELSIDLGLVTVDGSLYAPTWMTSTGKPNTASSDYMNDVLNAFFANNTYNIQYNFLLAKINSITSGGKLLTNLQSLINILFKIYSDYVTSVEYTNLNAIGVGEGYNSDNLLFLFNVADASYIPDFSTDNLTSDTLFLGGIANQYVGSSYQNLDAFKIFNSTLAINPTLVTPGYNIDAKIQELITNITYDLQKNIVQLLNVYKSLVYTNGLDNQNAKFMFNRLFTVKTGGYDLNSSWTNLSLQSVIDPSLQDNFTTDFTVTQVFVGEPPNVFHPMGQYVKDNVNNFHIFNRDIFRSLLYNGYFNQLSLWEGVDIIPSGFCPGIVDPIFYNTYFLNLIPFLTTNDIPNAILKALDIQIAKYPNPVKANIINIKAVITPLLNTTKTGIITDITPVIYVPDDFVTIEVMNNTYKTTTGINGDILDVSIIRQNEFVTTVDSVNRYIPDYVCQTYMFMLDDPTLEALPNYSSSLTINMKPILQQVVNLFRTPINLFPTFDVYSTQNYNQTTDPNLELNTSTTYFSDAISSIWWNLFGTVVTDYNNLYNDSILGVTPNSFNIIPYRDFFGAEIYTYLQYIVNNYYGSTIQPIQYYYVSTFPPLSTNLPPGNIEIFLNNKLFELQQQLIHFNENYGLLGMKNIIISYPLHYFDRYPTILNLIIRDNIEISTPTFTYYHENHPGEPPDPITAVDLVYPINTDYVLYVYNILKIIPAPPGEFDTVPRYTAMDILFKTNNDWYKLIFSATNPFDPLLETQLYDLYNSIQPLTEAEKISENNKYRSLFAYLNAVTFYNDLSNINVNYFGFILEQNVYSYMYDILISNSLLKDIPGLIVQFNVTATNQAIIDYLNNYIINNQEQIDSLLFVLSILELSLQGGNPASFAWIKYIGHYLINTIELYIGDQLIDVHTGESLHLMHQLSKRTQKERGFDILTGNVAELYTYNKDLKYPYEMIIPLKFWFCNNIGGSLPMVALNNTEVKLFVTLKNLSDVSYFDTFTKFVSIPKLECSMIGEYIFLEQEERSRIVKSKNEYLIEILQINGDVEIKADSLNVSPDLSSISINSFSGKLYFKNPVKEMIWGLQNLANINGTKTINNPNGDKQYYNYAFGIGEDYNDINPSLRAKIEFMSRDRELFKDILYYNVIQPHKYHSSIPSTGINDYSFSLEPENYQQPKGAVNMGRVDDSSIVTVLRDDVVLAMNEQNVKFRFFVYAISYQILRIMSGLAGIAFYY
jgi:hypothetical protein